MKKLNLVFLLLLCTPLIYAQSFDKLVKQFKDEQGVSYQQLDKSVLPASVNAQLGEGAIESIVILNLEECSPELLKKFDSTVRGLKIGKGYSTLVRENDEEEYTHILTKSDGGKVTELIVLEREKNEGTIVWIKGKGVSLDSLKALNK